MNRRNFEWTRTRLLFLIVYVVSGIAVFADMFVFRPW